MNRRRSLLVICLLATTLVQTGCAAVVSRFPLGERRFDGPFSGTQTHLLQVIPNSAGQMISNPVEGLVGFGIFAVDFPLTVAAETGLVLIYPLTWTIDKLSTDREPPAPEETQPQ